MTTCTSVMRFRGCAYKRIIMAASTTGCTHRDTRMAISGCRMKCFPGARMTGATVSRCRVAYSRTNKNSCAGIMTTCTRIMDRSICRINKRGITVTVSTARCTYYRDACMARIRCMGSLPGARMTGSTIGRGWVANGGADKSSRTCIMTTCTSVMRFRGCTYKRVIMAVGTTRCTHRDTRMAIPGCRVDCAPGARMAGGTIGRGRVAYS